VISLASYIINLSPHNELTVLTVQKMIAGLNSHTFNYLENNKGQLQITENIKNLTVSRVTQAEFYTSCVSLSRPCRLNGMSKTWPAFEQWSYEKGGD